MSGINLELVHHKILVISGRTKHLRKDFMKLVVHRCGQNKSQPVKVDFLKIHDVQTDAVYISNMV